MRAETGVGRWSTHTKRARTLFYYHDGSDNNKFAVARRARAMVGGSRSCSFLCDVTTTTVYGIKIRLVHVSWALWLALKIVKVINTGAQRDRARGVQR